MKNLKKILTLTLALALVLSLAACGGTPTPSAAPGESTEPAAPGEANEPAALTVTPGVLTMATNAFFPPYEFYEGQIVVGIDVEIAAAIAEKLGLTLEVEDMEFDSIPIAVNGGKADVGLAGMTVTPERQETLNFSSSYATGIQVIIVAEGSAITSVDDLFADGANSKIGVQRGTTGDLYTTWDLEEEGLATIDRYSKGTDAVMALKTGKVDCVVIDNEPAKAFVAENPGLSILDTEYVLEDYAIAIGKDNTALLEAVNKALEELVADGTIQAILDKYISA